MSSLSKRFFVTGIDTNVGKTVASAIIALALEAKYWKPVQAGDLDDSDSLKVKRWIGDDRVLPERFRLRQPMSPHAAAKLDGIEIKLSDITVPDDADTLIIEGAGGIMVPLNERETYLDWLCTQQIPTIVISKIYLGSINHTLLTLAALRAKNIDVAGVLFTGDENIETQRIIEEMGNVEVLGRIPWSDQLDVHFITEQAQKLKSKLECLK